MENLQAEITLLIKSLCLTVFMTAVYSAEAHSQLLYKKTELAWNFEVPQIMSENNRRYKEAFGGWGPHLRSLLRSSDNDLWFVLDSGPSVNANTELQYLKLSGGRWQVFDKQAIPHGVQQNAAHIMVGNSIYSYGLMPYDNGYIMECVLKTAPTGISKKHQTKYCRKLQLNDGRLIQTKQNSNYVGALISPSGQSKVVWWTSVGINGGAGEFSYIANYGDGWNGPFSFNLAPYNDLAYVHASFVYENKIALVGQLFQGAYPNGLYAAAYGEMDLAQSKFQFVPLNGLPNDSTISSGDIFVDPYKNVHILARTKNYNICYYFKESLSALENKCIHQMQQVYRTRFSYVQNEKSVLLVYNRLNPVAGFPALRILNMPFHKDAAFNFSDAKEVPSPQLTSNSMITAIFTESLGYQTQSSVSHDFAVIPSTPDDNLLYYFSSHTK